MIKIRKETSQDHKQVFELVKETFSKAEHTDGDEHFLVERLRKGKSFIPELSLVAEFDGEIVGHVMFTEIKVGNKIAICLAPVSVKIGFQKQGIGGELIAEGHRIARALGYEFSIVLGHPSYYPRFGYVNAKTFEISCPFEIPQDVFMAINLQGNDSKLYAQVEYPTEFFTK